MLLRRNLLVVIWGVIIASGAVSGTDVVGALGGEVSFGPDNPPPASVSSITWKHIKGGATVKAIEWEDGEITAPNSRFNLTTDLDTKTGKITIKTLKFEHSGVYTIDISGKEQTQRFTLTVIEPVPQPKIEVDPSGNPDFVYLSCKYSEKIIWKNSTGQTLPGSKINPKGESITVKKNGNPADFYTCTLSNEAGSKTSERVYKKDLFKAESGSVAGLIAGLIVVILLIVVIPVLLPVLYKHKCVPHDWGKIPYIGGWLKCLDRKKDDAVKPDAEKPDAEKPDAEKPDAEKPDAEKPDAEKPGAEDQDEDSNPAQPMLNSDEKNDRRKNNHNENFTAL